jgi:shikimate dehydrogenase
MKKFISLSKFPGNTGKTFYTNFFKHYNLDYSYDPWGCENLKQSIDVAQNQGVSGISISMPFKQEVLQYLGIKTETVEEFDSCNTILVHNGKLIGYNTDCEGAKHVIKHINKTDSIAILGNGSMATMFIHLLKDYNVTVFARSLNNWHERYNSFNVFINCTALGTSSSLSPFEFLPHTDLVIDLALKENQLSEQCKLSVTKYISGIEFYKFQFLKQFEIYTGIKINEEEFNRIQNGLRPNEHRNY